MKPERYENEKLFIHLKTSEYYGTTCVKVFSIFHFCALVFRENFLNQEYKSAAIFWKINK